MLMEMCPKRGVPQSMPPMDGTCHKAKIKINGKWLERDIYYSKYDNNWRIHDWGKDLVINIFSEVRWFIICLPTPK